MNEIYAIDPESPRDLRDLKALSETFGFRAGRFVAAYPDDWEGLLKLKSEIGDVERLRFIALLQRLSNALLPVRHPYKTDVIWEDNAQRERGRFSGGVLGKGSNKKGFPSFDDFLWGTEAEPWTASIGAHIDNTPKAYFDAISPLILMSREIHIFDRYLYDNVAQYHRTRDLFIEFLGKVAFLCSTHNRKISLCIHLFEIDDQPVERQTMRLHEALAAEMRGRIEKWVDLQYKKSERRHGRYVLSIDGGLQFDNGIVLGVSDRNHVHWLSQKELDEILAHIGL